MVSWGLHAKANVAVNLHCIETRQVNDDDDDDDYDDDYDDDDDQHELTNR